MSKFTQTAKTILKNISNLAVDRYKDVKIIASSIANNGFFFTLYNLSKVINEGYSSNTDVYSIISKIIRTGAKIPYKVIKILPDGTEERITSGRLYDSIMQPNPRQNKFEFTEDALGYQLVTGNEILKGVNPAGMSVFTRVYTVPPQLVNIKRYGKDFFEYTQKYILKWAGLETELEEGTINHVKYFNPTEDGLRCGMGLSPLQAAYNALSASNELMYASATALKNRGANGLLSAEGEHPLSTEEGDDLQETVNNKLGGSDKFNRIVATTARVKYTQFGLSPSDLKIIENGVLTLRQLCSVYGADSSSFNDPANKKYNNLLEAQKAFYINAVIPPLERHLLAYKELILPAWNKFDNAKYDIRLDLSGIEALQEDQAMKVTKQVNFSRGVTDIVMRVGEGKIKPESAVKILMMSFELSEEEAREIVSNTGIVE